MAKLVPAVLPATTPPGERRVFELLRDAPDEWIVLHSLDVANHLSSVSGEVDFVVIIPGVGILVVEVKSHELIACRDGQWLYGRNQTPGKNPFSQASNALHSLRQTVVERASEASAVPFAHCVVLPFASLRVQSAEWRADQLIDHASLVERTLVGSFKQALKEETARLRGKSPSSLTRRLSYRISQLLRPTFEVCMTPKERTAEAKREAREFTKAQFRALDALGLNPRVIFTGPAGTGKTLLAVEAYRRKVAEGKDVLFFCYNRNLAEWLRRVAGVEQAMTLHEFMLSLTSKPVPNSVRPMFWNEELPTATVRALGKSPVDARSIVVDEAQDLINIPFLDVLDVTVDGGLESGEWLFFGDFENQTLYRRDHSTGDDDLSLSDLQILVHGAPVFQLLENCRNTPRIGEAVQQFSSMHPQYSRFLRPDSPSHPDPVFVWCADRSDMATQLDASISRLLTAGTPPRDIAVLLRDTGLVHQLQTKTKLVPYREQLESDDQRICYSSIHGFKGLERPVVLLVGIEEVLATSAKGLFYVGASRAIQRLEILASEATKPQLLRALS